MRYALLLVLIACGSKGSTVSDQVLSISAHVYVLKSQATFAEYRDIMKTALALDPIVKIAAPIAVVEPLASSARTKEVPVVVKGEDEKQVTSLLGLDKLIVAGSLAELVRGGDPAPIVLGKGLAVELGVTIGDSLTLAIPADRRPVTDFSVDTATRPTEPLTKRFRVVAIFQFALGDQDKHAAYTTLAAAQAMLERGDTVSGIELRLSDPDRADDIARRLEDALGGMPYAARSWRELNKDLLAE